MRGKMKDFELLEFKYNEHVNNISTELSYVVNQNEISKHNMSKAKWEECYKNNAMHHSALLALEKDFFEAAECDYNNYIEWLIDGNKTR